MKNRFFIISIALCTLGGFLLFQYSHLSAQTKKDLLNKAFPSECKSGKLKVVYKLWPFPEWSYEEFPKHLNTALDLVRGQNCDWAVKLDIDTVFHENMYKEYQKLKEEGFVGMLIGKQESSKGKIRLGANIPRFCQIDIGNVLVHNKLLKLQQRNHKCVLLDRILRCYMDLLQNQK